MSCLRTSNSSLFHCVNSMKMKRYVLSYLHFPYLIVIFESMFLVKLTGSVNQSVYLILCCELSIRCFIDALQTYGPIISQIPKFLSKFTFNMMEIWMNLSDHKPLVALASWSRSCDNNIIWLVKSFVEALWLYIQCWRTMCLLVRE